MQILQFNATLTPYERSMHGVCMIYYTLPPQITQLECLCGCMNGPLASYPKPFGEPSRNHTMVFVHLHDSG